MTVRRAVAMIGRVNQPAAQLPVFRTGTHTSVDGREFTVTPEILTELAESYDPDLAEAPLVVGHPKLDAPAYGWAKALVADGETLFARPHQVEPAFAEAVNAGRYKKVSVRIYLPDSAGNPKPGKHYLRHIGFLGAAAPAVKGLASVQFSADDDSLEFASPLKYLGTTLTDLFQRLRDWMIERDGAEAADRVIPQWAIRSIDTDTDPPDELPATAPAFAAPSTSTEITMDPKDLEKQKADLEARERAIAERELSARRNDAVAFAEQLVKDGKVLPRHQAPVVELLLALPADTSIAFAEGSQQIEKPAAQALREFLSELTPRIDYREKSGVESAPASIAFAAPDNAVIDAGRADLYQRAKSYQTQHPGTGWIDAVRAVGG